MDAGTAQFSGYEVMRAAMEIEMQGRNFYQALSHRVSCPQARTLFTQLAEDEVQHLRTLGELLDGYRRNDSWENEQEYLPYLARFHAESVFPTLEQVEAAGDRDATERRALELAIAAENRFAEYFRQAARHARSSEGRQAFNWLADEEVRHAEILERRLRELCADGPG